MATTALPLAVRFAVVLTPTVIALRDVAPNAQLMIVGTVAALLMLAAVSLVTRPNCWRGKPGDMLVPVAMGLVCVVMIAQAFLRHRVEPSPLYGASAVLVAAMVLVVLLFWNGATRRETVLLATDSLALLVLASTLMHFAGVASTTAIALADLKATTLLYKFGFGIMREVMPLTNGMTSHSAICGLVALSSALVLANWRTSLGRKLFTGAALGAALYGLAVTDGRAAMAASGGLLLVAVFTPWLRWRVWRYAGWLMAVSVPVFLGLAALAPRDLLALVARSGMAAEIVEGNSRVKIWGAIWRALVEQPLDFVFGYGLYGQVTSGIGGEISRLFVAWGGSSYYSAHNAGMQVLLDGGVVALAVFIWFYNSALSGASQSYGVNREPEDRLALVFVLYILLVGVLDTLGTMVWREVFFALAVLGSRYAPVRAVRREPVTLPGVFLTGEGPGRSRPPPPGGAL